MKNEPRPPTLPRNAIRIVQLRRWEDAIMVALELGTPERPAYVRRIYDSWYVFRAREADNVIKLRPRQTLGTLHQFGDGFCD
jgi:hypothetical protein